MMVIYIAQQRGPSIQSEYGREWRSIGLGYTGTGRDKYFAERDARDHAHYGIATRVVRIGDDGSHVVVNGGPR